MNRLCYLSYRLYLIQIIFILYSISLLYSQLHDVGLTTLVLYSTKSGSWLVIIGEPLLVLYSTISLKVLYSTFAKWSYVEP